MGSLRRRVLAGACAALGAATLLATGAPAGAVPTKGSIDACALITDADLSGLSTTYSVSKTDDLSAKNCLYSLQGDGDSATVNLFVDKPSDFTTQKAGVKKAKKVSGLPSGYAGEFYGDAQVGFKAGPNAIRIVSTDIELPDLILVAKAIKQHL